MPRVAALLALLVLSTAQPLLAQSARMNFFLTSVGKGDGANLGGLPGADAHCELLAYGIGKGHLMWRAYLSTAILEGRPAVNARDRIGIGPWYNHDGILIAENVDDLHSPNALITKESLLSEQGTIINGRGDSPNRHDILTGSSADGRAIPGSEDTTCDNWSTSSAEGSARVGHFDRQGGGEDPTSWNSAHGSQGCSQENLRSSGGDGLFLCFGVPSEE